MKLFVTTLLLACTMSQTHAGNGSSGGGHIFGNQLNPWFVGNTKKINYCVEISPEFSDLSRDRVITMIQDAIKSWKNTLQSSNFQERPIGDNPEMAVLAGQDFLLQAECNTKTDITFQMGILSEIQRKLIPDYKHLIGMAYRTEYDEVNLKGKGFIYLAPERGELRPVSQNMDAKPWSFGKNYSLKGVLTHELGHVFGLQDDFQSFGGIMGATSPETMTTKSGVRIIDSLFQNYPELDTNKLTALGCTNEFNSGLNFYHLNDEEGTRDLLKLSPSSKRFKVSSKNGVLEILDITTQRHEVIGTINLKAKSSATETVPGVRLYLTKKQKVFKNVESSYYNSHRTIYDINQQIIINDLELKLKNGDSIKVFVKFNSGCSAQIGTIYQDRVRFDIMSI